MRKFKITESGSVIIVSLLIGAASVGCRTPTTSVAPLAFQQAPPPPLPAIPSPDPSAAEVPSGYQVEIVASGLNSPSSVELDDDGALYIAESGYGDEHDATAARITC